MILQPNISCVTSTLLQCVFTAVEVTMGYTIVTTCGSWDEFSQGLEDLCSRSAGHLQTSDVAPGKHGIMSCK